MRSALNYSLLIIFCALIAGKMQAVDTVSLQKLPQGIHSIIEVKELDTYLLELDNGMRVALKHSKTEDDVYVRLTALGGFSSLPSSQIAGGVLSPQIAIRSGLGNYGFDQFYAALYENNVDIDASVQPFSRSLEGATEPEHLDFLLGLINSYFTKHVYTKDAFHKVLEKEKAKVSARGKDSTKYFNEQFLSFNSQDYAPFRPLKDYDLDAVDFNVSKEFFDNAFSDPSSFVTVIVGPFDQNQVYEEVARHLATIPQVKEKKLPLPQSLPKIVGIKSKVVNDVNYAAGSITRITIPVQGDVTEDSIDGIEAIAHLLNIRLRNRVAELYPSDNVMVNVNLEFPLYPNLSSAWITAQFITGSEKVAPVGKSILAEIKRLQLEGMTDDEITSLRKKIRKNQKLWQKDNNYWVMVLSNYMLWDWNPKNIKYRYRNKSYLQKSELSKLVKTKIDLNHYTIFSAQDQ